MHKKSSRIPGTPARRRPAHPDAPGAPEYSSGSEALRTRNFDLAAEYFNRALQADSRQPHYWRAFATVSRMQGKINEAARGFCKALELDPGFSHAWNDLGNLYQSQGRFTEAAKCYQKSMELDPDGIDAHIGLGHTLLAQGKMEQSEQALRRAVRLDPRHIPALQGLAYSLKGQGRHAEARTVYLHAWRLKPNDLQACIGAHLTLPTIYSSLAELSASRKQFAEGLKKLHANTETFMKSGSKELLSGLNWTNFYLAYQGEDDKFLQTEYARFVAKIVHSAAPDLMRPIRKNPSHLRNRIRIGFLSSFLRNCTVGSYFKSWITSLNRETFDIFCYFTGSIRDHVTEELARSSDHAAFPRGSAEDIGRKIKQDQLDILIYPEIGMDPVTCTLSAMRLAPVQCAAWGHPVTTGHAHIDYFFSSVLMEPENAQDHYSERLILLSGIGTCYSKPPPPSPAKRSDFSLPEERILYLCPQSLYKIHPDNDRLLSEILARNQNASLVFFQANDLSITRAFMKRLETTLDDTGVKKTGQIKMLPRMEHTDYLRINLLCDVMLDTLHWSGGNTTLDALACGLPVVTLPGKFMRGRQSYGMLKYMGMDELIAQGPQEYIEIATRLGLDHTWRTKLAQRIARNSDTLFSDESPVRQLEALLTMQMDTSSCHGR